MCTNLKLLSLRIKFYTVQKTSQQYSIDLLREPLAEIHTYNTRFASKLNFHRPKANNNYGTSTFAFVSSQLWETIPTNIKRLPYTSFCNQYKLYLLNMQSSEQPVY